MLVFPELFNSKIRFENEYCKYLLTPLLIVLMFSTRYSYITYVFCFTNIILIHNFRTIIDYIFLIRFMKSKSGDSTIILAYVQPAVDESNMKQRFFIMLAMNSDEDTVTEKYTYVT